VIETAEARDSSPADARASIAVDLGAESCRVSLLRWIDATPHLELVHRFSNGPVREAEGSLRWPLDTILAGVDHGMRLCAERAPEGIRSVAVDGWAVDYVRLDAQGAPLAPPFCYRDERTTAAEQQLHKRISADRLRSITGIQRQPINTLYQLYADRVTVLPSGHGWLNLPEFLLARWGGEPVSEYTNATHTEMVDLERRRWSREILDATEIDPALMPRIVPPGTLLGRLTGELAGLPAFRNTQLIAPACHDTASAIAGIADEGDDWGYISSGTWSLIGTLLDHPCNGPAARAAQFTNLGAVGDRLLFQKNVNGLWLLKQCMEAWSAAGATWDIAELCAAAEHLPSPPTLLDVDDPDLLRMEDMPGRINAQLRRNGRPALNESPAHAPAIASLIFHSLAARYADIFAHIEEIAGKRLSRIYMVGGGSRNTLLRRLAAQATGRSVFAGSPESSTLGNFAVQLAALEEPSDRGKTFRIRVARYAALLTRPHP
jgi:rhamnulokinase